MTESQAPIIRLSASASKVEETRVLRARRGAGCFRCLPPAPTWCAPSILPQNHLHLVMHDIAEAQAGWTLPGLAHVQKPCWPSPGPGSGRGAGGELLCRISRSTASAYIIAAALSPQRDEEDWRGRCGRLSAVCEAQSRLVAVADEVLGRRGRMVEAIRAIGRGEDAFEGVPFTLPV